LLEEGYIFGLDFIENNYSDYYTYGFACRANLAKYSAAAIMPVPVPKRNETKLEFDKAPLLHALFPSSPLYRQAHTKSELQRLQKLLN